MAVDAQDRVVVGTTDGLVTYDGEVLSVLREGDPHGPTSDRVTGVVNNGDVLWVIAADGVIQRRGPDDVRVVGRIDAPGEVFAHRDGDGVFLQRGGWRYDVTDNPMELPESPIPGGPPEDLQGKPVTTGRITTFNEQVFIDGELVAALPLTPFRLLAHDGDWWMSSMQGLFRVRRTPFRVVAAPPGQYVPQVFRHPDTGDVWGALSGGRARLKTDGTVVPYRWQSGEPIQTNGWRWPVPIGTRDGQMWWHANGHMHREGELGLIEPGHGADC